MTEDALEDRDVHALFKGRTAVPAPFLMTLLRDLAVDFVVFVTFLTDNVVLEATESADGEERDEWRYDEDRNNTEFWQLIV